MTRAPDISPKPRSPLLEMLAIAAPTVVTMTSYTVMQFVDGMMVARIPIPRGAEGPYVAAQGNGGILVWLLISFMMGMTGVINSFVSQNLGAGRPERGSAYAWAGLWMSAAWAVLLAGLIPLLPFLFGWLGGMANHSPELVRLETGYARVMLLGLGFTCASRALSHFFYGLHKPMVVMISALVANVVNVCCNAVLIYGPAGPPEGTPLAAVFQSVASWLGLGALGVEGAAWGTVIGSIVELIIPMALFLSAGMNAKYKTRSAWKPPRVVFKDIIRIGWPAGAMFTNELICWGYLMAVLLSQGGQAAGENGDLHNTAGWIALRYMHLSFMPAVGLSIAITAMVGKAMGQKRPDLAAARTWLGVKVAMTYMGLCALGFILFKHHLIGVFTNKGEMDYATLEALTNIGSRVMIAAAVFQLFDALAISISGALRGAGDTVWPGVATVVLSWLCIPALGHLLIWQAPELGSIGPWIGAAAYIISLSMALTTRFLGGKWRSMSLVREDGAEPRVGVRAMGEPSDPGPAPDLTYDPAPDSEPEPERV